MPIIFSTYEVLDIRTPTSDTLLGSDPFHKKPNYSVVMTKLNTNTNLTGISVSFTIGAGNDWMVYCVKDLCKLLKHIGSKINVNIKLIFFKWQMKDEFFKGFYFFLKQFVIRN